MSRSRYQNTTKKDWIKDFTYLAIFLALIAAGGILLLPEHWYIYLVLVAVLSFALVRWHAQYFAYRCTKCGTEFQISTFADFISPHGINKHGGWKYLKCPNCRKWSKAQVIKRVTNSDRV